MPHDPAIEEIIVYVYRITRNTLNAVSRRLWREQGPVWTDRCCNRRECCDFIECGVRSRASSLRAKQRNLPWARKIIRVTVCPIRLSMFSTQWIVTRVMIDVRALPASNITAEPNLNTSPTPMIPVRYVLVYRYHFYISILLFYLIFMKIFIW